MPHDGKEIHQTGGFILSDDICDARYAGPCNDSGPNFGFDYGEFGIILFNIENIFNQIFDSLMNWFNI